MCGRYSLGLEAGAVEVIYDAKWASSIQKQNWRPRYNMAPEQHLPIIKNQDEHRIITYSKWGLVPHWAKDERQGAKSINARAETIDEKPMFRDAFQKRRCLVIADGFYEWNAAKTPYRACLPGAKPHAYAGLWDRWQSPNGETIDSFCIITRDAIADLRVIHHRMPVLIDPQDYDVWLDEENQNVVALKRLLFKQPFEVPRPYEVSKIINSARTDTLECILAEVEITEKQVEHEIDTQKQAKAVDQLSFGWSL